jgi:hypothetical protein
MRPPFNLYAVLHGSGMTYCPADRREPAERPQRDRRETAPKRRDVFGKNTGQKPCGTALNRTAALSTRESIRPCAGAMPRLPACH